MTFILTETIDVLLPFLTEMVNVSLREGCLPASQKRAIITPLLNKPTLDAREPVASPRLDTMTFRFPKVKWLQYTGEVGKCTRY